MRQNSARHSQRLVQARGVFMNHVVYSVMLIS